MRVDSNLISLKDIVDAEGWQFSIPIYQRLYVWGKDQVDTLLNDFANAYEAQEEIFFLGGTLTVERKEQGRPHFELIDGQQRFTTLWILSYAWKEALEPYITFSEADKTIVRISFAIRQEVNNYLKSLALDAPKELTDKAKKQTEKIRNAVARMKSFINDRTKDCCDEERAEYLRGITRFIYERVKLVITQVPEQMDLNKLFEVINNRGIQLQHHEILKAKMLDLLSESERPTYACLWESCADMDGFIERNLSSVVGTTISGKEISHLFEKEAADAGKEKLRNAENVIDLIRPKLDSASDETALSLDSILQNSQKYAGYVPDHEDDDEDGTWARSVIGFPLLLQHVLRIWLHRNQLEDLPKILDRELLSLFDDYFFVAEDKAAQGHFVKSFIRLLWEIRYLFDKHVIKWAIPNGEDEIQMITSIRLIDPSSGSRSLNREKTENPEVRELGLIQSFLYHSQEITTHYWLTPFLNFIHKHPNSVAEYTRYLKHLDNCLLGSQLDEKLVERTKLFLDKPWLYSASRHDTSLTKDSGVHFWSYWFYKLEFVLWCNRDKFQDSDDRWKNFRFTAKNSVEHISPRSPKERDLNKVDSMLDHFGNLALVSRSLNSEYSNLPYNEKRQRFENNNAKKIDSLKMSLIYKNEHWNDELAEGHQNDMITLMSEYYESSTVRPNTEICDG